MNVATKSQLQAGARHSVVSVISSLEWIAAGDGKLLMLEQLSCLLRTGTAYAQQQVQQEVAGRHVSLIFVQARIQHSS